LKLKLDPSQMAKLKRASVMTAQRQSKTQTSRLTSIYWDTADFALAKAGIVIKVRADKQKHTLTVKTTGSRSAALHSRQEWEWPVLSDQPNPYLLESTGLKALLDPDVISRLVPIFTTHFRRTFFRLGDGDWEGEVSMDEGNVGVAHATEDICEVELELIRGPASALVALAQKIVEVVPARLLIRAKSERGLDLAQGKAPTAVKASPGEVDTHMTVEEAFQAIARNCINQIIANERSLVATGDPEAVHQMRVALRRLRSATRLFRAVVDGADMQSLKPELSWLQNCLGPARDFHVFLEEIVAPVVDAHSEVTPLLQLKADWAKAADTRRDDAVAAILTPRFTLLILALMAWTEAGDWRSDESKADLRAIPITDFARAVLVKRMKRIRRHATKTPETLPEEQLHELRILCKQMRYTSEFFAPLFPRKSVRSTLEALAALQDILGQLNDIAVAAQRLTSGMSDGPVTETDGGRSWAAGLVAGWHAGRKPALLGKIAAAWRQLDKLPPYWS
jgi:inorganic triphosphatase YgiF